MVPVSTSHLLSALLHPRANYISCAPPGIAGERYVAQQLERQLYFIWDTNWEIRAGELDIVAQKESTLFIIEVKTRHARTDNTYAAERAVDIFKTERLRYLADRYLYQNQKRLKRYRIRSIQFDIAAVSYQRLGPLYTFSLAYYSDAFSF